MVSSLRVAKEDTTVPENPNQNADEHAPFASREERDFYDRHARHLFEEVDLRRLAYEATLTPQASDAQRVHARQRWAQVHNAMLRLIALGLYHDPDPF